MYSLKEQALRSAFDKKVFFFLLMPTLLAASYAKTPSSNSFVNSLKITK
jgi:hypothetical protein